ncbi:pirin family protein [Candidatus Albibeggiatoa sp. nov. NOAA]|uniref:pirin family protein n=1 Tax=Candidatus Albibeggiatoa sp. nov. NOAA TaxID=3162724 RepID=UPI0032F33B4A|nr:pirin family protein [Thiotrichaceae bacterium]
MNMLHRDQLPLGGFAGLTEHRLVVDQRVGGDSGTWNGLGNFVYLADAHFQPHGETRMHPHKEIDVISVLVEGRIEHQGSLEHGQSLQTDQAQAQRAGGEGFNHNEINPDSKHNRMIQLWVLPETRGEAASYKLYNLAQNQLTRIYGGVKHQRDTLDSHTIIEVGLLSAEQAITKNTEFMAYITRGHGVLNGETVQDGDLVRGDHLDFNALDDVQIIIITTDKTVA